MYILERGNFRGKIFRNQCNKWKDRSVSHRWKSKLVRVSENPYPICIFIEDKIDDRAGRHSTPLPLSSPLEYHPNEVIELASGRGTARRKRSNAKRERGTTKHTLEIPHPGLWWYIVKGGESHNGFHVFLCFFCSRLTRQKWHGRSHGEKRARVKPSRETGAMVKSFGFFAGRAIPAVHLMLFLALADTTSAVDLCK